MGEPVKPVESPAWDTTQTNYVAPDGSHVNNGVAFNEIPPSNVFNGWMNIIYRFINWLTAGALIIPGGQAPTGLAIASNQIVPTAGTHFLTGSGTVNLLSTANHNAGRLLRLHGTTGQTVVLGNLTGSAAGFAQMQTADGDSITLLTEQDIVEFRLNAAGNLWRETFRSASLPTAAPAMMILTTPGSGSTTVPLGKTAVKFRGVGGGGGGGGSGSVNTTLSGTANAGSGGGGGGSAGCYQEFILTGLVGGAALNYNVGAAGTAGAGGVSHPGYTGGNGGISWVGSSATGAAGGNGGVGGGSTVDSSAGAGGAGGALVAATNSSTVLGVSSTAGTAGGNGSNTGDSPGAGGAASSLATYLIFSTAGGAGAAGVGRTSDGNTNGTNGTPGSAGWVVLEWL